MTNATDYSDYDRHILSVHVAFSSQHLARKERVLYCSFPDQTATLETFERTFAPNANPNLDICSCGTGKDIAVDQSKKLGATAKAAFPG